MDQSDDRTTLLIMPTPSYTPFTLAQGFDVGLRSRQAEMENRLALRRAEQAQQQLEEEARKNRVSEGLDFTKLGEQRRQFDVGFGDTTRRTSLAEREQAERERAAKIGEDISRGKLGVDSFSAMQDALNRANTLSEQRRHSQVTEGQEGTRLASDIGYRGQQQDLAEREQGLKYGLAGQQQHLAEQEQGLKYGAEDRKLSLEERTQAQGQGLAEREQGLKYGTEGRRLALEERTQQQAQGLAGSKFEEEKRAAGVREGLAGRAQTLDETKTAQDFELRQQAQQLTEREIAIKERQENRRLDLSEKQTIFAQNLEQLKFGEQQRVSRFNEGIEGRQQTEAEKTGATNRWATQANVGVAQARLELDRLKTSLDNQIQSRTLDITQAKNIYDAADRIAEQGLSVSKWLQEIEMRQSELDSQNELRSAQAENYRASASDNMVNGVPTSTYNTNLKNEGQLAAIEARGNLQQGTQINREELQRQRYAAETALRTTLNGFATTRDQNQQLAKLNQIYYQWQLTLPKQLSEQQSRNAYNRVRALAAEAAANKGPLGPTDEEAQKRIMFELSRAIGEMPQSRQGGQSAADFSATSRLTPQGFLSQQSDSHTPQIDPVSVQPAPAYDYNTLSLPQLKQIASRDPAAATEWQQRYRLMQVLEPALDSLDEQQRLQAVLLLHKFESGEQPRYQRAGVDDPESDPAFRALIDRLTKGQ